MKRKKKHLIRYKQPGTPPGTLQFTGEKRVDTPLVFTSKYGPERCEMGALRKDEVPSPGISGVHWYEMRGLHDVSLVESLGSHFNIHPLVLEDVLNTRQRPKCEEYGDEVFLVISALKYDPEHAELLTEQIAIYFGENFLLSFQEHEDDTFAPVRNRLESGRGRIRSRNADYLAYALMDSVVDNYFSVIDHFESLIDELEAEINERPSRQAKVKIHRLKFQLLALRRSVLPLREAIGKFSRCESKSVHNSTSLFVRDLYDHVIRIADSIETHRDMLNGLQELYLSELSIRTNNVIQVLTIITTVFVPLTFLAGVYGMNFDNMPELHWNYGYFYVLGLMGLIFLSSLLFFKRKRWI